MVSTQGIYSPSLCEESYDELNMLMREMALEQPPKLYVGSGEDFNVEKTYGAPNRLWALVEEV